MSLGHRTFMVRDGKVVDVSEERRREREPSLEVRVVDNAHVSHALPKRRDAPGMNWNKWAKDASGHDIPRFDTNNDVREFCRRNPTFARE